MNNLNLKKDFIFKKTYVREKFLIRGFDNFIELGLKLFSRELKFLQFDIFSRDADCQLGGGGPKMGIFSVSWYVNDP